ncbi:MAG TPA: hypothetical protein VJ695_04850 [Nitrososphaera sp.]|nr:hypothetical protein [Nitrososphaera sp.]
MPNIDPNPLPYGPLQYYQTHYIVQTKGNNNDKFLARCRPITKGHFQNKRMVDVRWTGDGNLVKTLQSDIGLTEMLKEVMIKVREITIDPQDDHVRIYSSWVHEENIAFDPLMLEIADRIALHIKNFG